MPLEEFRHRIIPPEGKNLSIKAGETDIKPEISTENGLKTSSISIRTTLLALFGISVWVIVVADNLGWLG